MKQIIRYSKFIFLIYIFIGYGISQNEVPGCMDDGLQQYSPFPGVPACNYNPLANVESDDPAQKCVYPDCNQCCPYSQASSWPNPINNPDQCQLINGTADYLGDNNKYYKCSIGDNVYLTEYDCLSSGGVWYQNGVDDCGICGGNNSTCLDCNNIPNGLAYYDCNSACVGGNTDNNDIFQISIETAIASPNSTENNLTLSVSNMPILEAFDIEIEYNPIKIVDINIIPNSNYILGEIYDWEDEIISDSDDMPINKHRIKFSLYQSGELLDQNSTIECSSEFINFMNIIFDTGDVFGDAELVINELILNGHYLNISNWNNGLITIASADCNDDVACNYNPNTILSDENLCIYPDPGYDCNGIPIPIEGCTDIDACNYNSSANQDDGSCLFDSDQCGICGGPNIDCNSDTWGTNVCPDADCNGECGGLAYVDACNKCIYNDLIDCFTAEFILYDNYGSQITQIDYLFSDTIYIATYFKNLPNNLEGLNMEINYNNENLNYIGSSLSLDTLNPNIEIKGVLSENEISFYSNLDSIQGLYKAILYPNYDEQVAYNEYLPNDDGTYIFIGFEINNYDDPNSSPDSIDFNYEVIQINENIMKKENYIAQEIYLSVDQKIHIPNQYLLGQNYPNPFNPITYIEYSVPNYENIKLEILNIQGQQIKTIINEYHQPGFYQVVWAGKNDLGKAVPSGIYFYRLESMKYSLTKKLILLK